MTDAENLALAQAWIAPVIRDWWNDCCRKTWRRDFDDPALRTDLLNDLQARLGAALLAFARAKGETMRLSLLEAVRVPTSYDGGETPLDEYGKRVLRVAIKSLRAHAGDVPPCP